MTRFTTTARAILLLSWFHFLNQSQNTLLTAVHAIDVHPPHPTFPTGLIEDTKCDVEQLEEANDSQLFTILHDLKQTSFFRNFAVDLDQTCPLRWERRSTTTPDSSKQNQSKKESLDFTKQDSTEEENEAQCASEGLPDADEFAEPACHVDLGNSMLPPWQTSTGMKNEFESFSETTVESSASDESSLDVPASLQEECDGGSIADEVDEDAPPLCHLSEAEALEFEFDHQYTKTPIRDLLSNALNDINRKLGWDSVSEKKTFTWMTKTDPVVLSHAGVENCDEAVEGKLPDSFWLDMCVHVTEGDGMKLVDLVLNPERNTGYNGTHIWKAIYEENCLDLDGHPNQPMCYEERVLYRLLSGLHTSTTLSIAKNYYPPSKKRGRDSWTPNPSYFYDKFAENPEYIRNLHFSYTVLLRALKKAQPFLSRYEIRTGNIVDDETAMILLRRLLDSSILRSCGNVFEAFDESLMFRQEDVTNISFDTKSKEVITLQQNFKDVFHNVSSILDCVQCQQCKLHGKMAMLGYGTALKILFMTNEELIASSLNRNEIVAFINTIAKMSESMKDVRELTHLYWTSNNGASELLPTPSPAVPSQTVLRDSPFDVAVGATATWAKAGLITPERETELIELAIQKNEEFLTLAKHYGDDLNKLLLFTNQIAGNLSSSVEPDAIIVGTGLAGLSAALNILDRGGKVVLIEKEHILGGNSNKASSGINACCPNNSSITDDNIDSFYKDATKSAGKSAQPELIHTLVKNSAKAINWLQTRVGVDLSLLAQLGGHAHKRTHRPKNGMVGAEVIYGMQREVKKFEKSGQVKILTDTKVNHLVRDESGKVIGVDVEYLTDPGRDQSTRLKATSVILATGGFAADRTNSSLLSKYRPELLKMPATAGPFSTGDGISLATQVGADLIDMEKVQIHPTGWVDPKDPSNPNKILAAELMRGVGGILINSNGKRFCNELGTRAYVTDMMLRHDPYYAKHKEWNKESEIPTFSLVLSSSAAADGKKHVDHYVHKGLLTKIQGVDALATWMGQSPEIIRNTLLQYRADATNGTDQWGKSSFQGLPDADLENETFFAGTVTPVLHYCMGGITIDKHGNVLDHERKPIPGLHAAGEVTGGVHGDNRLGGNSLLECTVFGTIVGEKVPIKQRQIASSIVSQKVTEPKQLREINPDELAIHNTKEDCWVAIHGFVYDLTEFADEHPAGADSILRLGGTDGTEEFDAIHNAGIMEDFDDERVGIFVG
jgi:flavocytochrome c